MAISAGDPSRYEAAALDAVRWLRQVARPTEHGSEWPWCPAQDDRVNYGLYYGSSGVILALLDSCKTANDRSLLEEACRGADALVHHVNGESRPGLYSGLAGQCIALARVSDMSGRQPYADAARSATQLLIDRATPTSTGVEWSVCTDVMDGTAGIGLALLEMAGHGVLEAADTACQAGERLLALAAATADGGVRWLHQHGNARDMPNFSHGTAGVAYFLVSLYIATADVRFLDAAERGARHLLHIAVAREGRGSVIRANDQEGQELFYLGWCHGPVGTSRLFYRLWTATGCREWLDALARLTRPLLSSGIPEQRPPGYWNKIGLCCGSAGIAEYLLDLYQLTGASACLELAIRLTNDLLDRGTDPWWAASPLGPDAPQPPPLTGWMQGAAGMTSWLLRFSRFLRGRPEYPVRLPDSPWPLDPNAVVGKPLATDLFDDAGVE